MTDIFDAHTHIDYIRRCKPDTAAVVNSVATDDWQQIIQLCEKRSHLRPAFGIHPWAASQFGEDIIWQHKLDHLLSSVPNASVGEAGLDRDANAPLDRQIYILKSQLSIAMQHNCAVSLHCHKSFDILLPIIRRYNLTFIMHGYSGSSEITRSLLDMDVYFSFGKIRDSQTDRLCRIISIIPQQRLLVESDGKSDADITATAAFLGQCCGITPTQLCKNWGNVFGENNSFR